MNTNLGSVISESDGQNSSLESLEPPILDDLDMVRALVDELRANTGLIELRLSAATSVDLFQSMAHHSSTWAVAKVHGRTAALQDMLRTHEVMQDMKYVRLFLMRRSGRRRSPLAPRLQINRFRQNFDSFHQIENESTRAHLLAHAMSRVSSLTPFLV
jgi:hypothetical protein